MAFQSNSAAIWILFSVYIHCSPWSQLQDTSHLMLNLVLFTPQLLENKFGWCSFCHWWPKPIPDYQVCFPCCHGFALVARVSSENSPAGIYEIHLEQIHISKFQFYTKQLPRAVARSSLCLNLLNSLELYQFITWGGGGSVFQKQLSVLKSHCLFAVLSCIFSEWVISFSPFLTYSSSALHV